MAYLRDQEETEGLVSEIEWLVDQGVKVKLVPNLHAKIYANESTAVVSSMNLTAYSTSNFRKIAIQVDKGLTRRPTSCQGRVDRISLWGRAPGRTQFGRPVAGGPWWHRSAGASIH